MRKHLYTTLLMLAVLAMGPGELQAQKRSARVQPKNDTLSVMRQFIDISNVYNRLPLQLEMTLQQSTNFITSESDTTQIDAAFYLQSTGSYVRFGEAEQFVNDSMALLVSNRLQRMILYADAKPVTQQMQAVINRLKGDSSLQSMAARFTARYSTAETSPVILLASREMVYGTSFPKEELILQYAAQGRQPVKVTTIKRSLLAVSHDDYKTLGTRSDLQGKLFAQEGKGYFLVKEQSAAFIYKSIRHEIDFVVPATMADRVIRDEEGRLVPVKQYEGYAMTYN